MRNFLLQLLTFAALSCVTPGIASADPFTVTISFDKFGMGTFQNNAGYNGSLSSALQDDPGPGGLLDALFVDMQNPPGLTNGDVQFMTGSIITGLLRFNGSLSTASGQGGFFVYSAKIPSLFYDNVVSLGYSTLISYTPTAGQPGFVSGAGGPVTYLFTSNAVPEPSSILLVLGGAAVLLVQRRLTV